MSNDIDLYDFHQRLHQFSIKHKPYSYWVEDDKECKEFDE